VKHRAFLLVFIVLIVLLSSSFVSADILLYSNDTETNSTANIWTLVKTITVSPSAIITYHMNELKNPNAAVTTRCAINWTYDDDSIGSAVNSTFGNTIYNEKTYTNPDQVKKVKLIRIYLRTDVGGDTTKAAYEKLDEVWATDTNPPTITANATYPDPALPTQDWQINITATSDFNATFTAWTQFYINSTISGSQISKAISNNTNTNIANLSAASIHDGDTLTAEVWVGNGQSNLTKLNITGYTIDYTNPVITPDDIALNQTHVYLKHNLTSQINASDPNLYSINVSIDSASIFNISNYNSSLYVYNLSRNMSSYDVGLHDLSFRACDGHTALSLKDEWDYNIGLYGLTYKDGKKWYRINPVNSDLFESITTAKMTDKYSFTYSKSFLGKLLNPDDKYTFIVESSDYIDIINSNKYNAWLVIPTIGSTGRWIDFNLKDAKDAKYSIKRLNDKQVEITITNIPKDIKELVFSSTGELNCITDYYKFYVYNYTATSSDYSFETDYQTMTFEINKSSATTNAELYWNNTLKSSSKTSYTGYDKYTAVFRTPFIASQAQNITAYWNYNTTGDSGNTTFNQTIYRMSIDNCSIYSTKAINFTLMDEVENKPLNISGEIHTAMQIYRSNISDYRVTNLEFSGSNNYSVCIYSSFAAYTLGSTNFEYMATGYLNRDYSISALGISNATQEIKLYLTSTADSTNVIISLRDTDDNALEDYNIRVKRYYPATGEEVTSEIARTDYNGKAVARLILYNYYYSFSIEELDGTVIKLISPSKIYADSLTFIVDITETELSFEDKVWYSISPASPVLSQPVNFTLTTSSPGNYIEWFAIGTRFNSTDYLDNSTDADGGEVSIELDLTNQTGYLTITYYIKAANETLLTFNRGYYVTDITPGDLSIEGQREGWEDVFDTMWRVIVAVFVSVIAVLLLVQYTGPEFAGVVGVLVQIGFIIMGWIPLWMVIVEAFVLFGLYLLSSKGAT